MYNQTAIPLAATFLSSTQRVLQNGNRNKSVRLTVLQTSLLAHESCKIVLIA